MRSPRNKPQFFYTLDSHIWINLVAIAKTSRMRRIEPPGRPTVEDYTVTLFDGSEHKGEAERFETALKHAVIPRSNPLPAVPGSQKGPQFQE